MYLQVARAAVERPGARKLGSKAWQKDFLALSERLICDAHYVGLSIYRNIGGNSFVLAFQHGSSCVKDIFRRLFPGLRS